MPLPTRPLRTIFPFVVALQAPWRVSRFLGTGFFIRLDGTFMTARHLVRGLELATHETFAIVLNQERPFFYPALDFRMSNDFDIAIGRVENRVQNPIDIEILSLANSDAEINLDILTVEYSGTRTERLDDTGTVTIFTPYFRKGHVICRYVSNYPERRPTSCLDISFPALLGASGAPVVVERDGTVTGMITANIERHLIPAQVERIEEQAGATEERRYFLPTGKAISWLHLRDFAAAQGVLGP